MKCKYYKKCGIYDPTSPTCKYGGSYCGRWLELEKERKLKQLRQNKSHGYTSLNDLESRNDFIKMKQKIKKKVFNSNG